MAYELTRDSTGNSIRWAGSSIHFVVDPHSRDLADDAVMDAVQRAAQHWADVTSLQITIDVEDQHGAPGYDRDHPDQNKNEIFFIDSDWELDDNVLATTLVTVDINTHTIVDTDILVNGAQHRFAILPDSSQPNSGIYDDLEAAITHEMGHVLGLAHTSLVETTMYPSLPPGEVSKRHLADDDIAGAQSLYSGPTSGEPTDVPNVGCSTVPSTRPPLVSLGFMVALLLFRTQRLPLRRTAASNRYRPPRFRSVRQLSGSSRVVPTDRRRSRSRDRRIGVGKGVLVCGPRRGRVHPHWSDLEG